MANHKNEGDHYGKHKSGTHGVKGHKFGETESHKKGHKTTGFHNVYHKDEYNKEQKFYDDAHKHGKYDKYGGKHKDFTQKAGGHKHGTSHESGYDEAHKGAAGQFDKGSYYDAQKGHSGESGHKSHHDHKAEYDTLSDNKKYGEHEAAGGDDFYWAKWGDDFQVYTKYMIWCIVYLAEANTSTDLFYIQPGAYIAYYYFRCFTPTIVRAACLYII